MTPPYMNINTLVIQAGFEPATHGLEDRCSIQLSYWTMCEEFSPKCIWGSFSHLYLTLQTVFHTQLFKGMWVLKVETLALYVSCQIGSGLPLTLIFVYSFLFT
jgi:hypothetical protein